MTKQVRWMTGILLLWALPAAAQDSECATDADCGQGRVCQELEIGGGCADIACDGPGCVMTEPVCTTETILVCVPGPCDSDADCADGEVCLAEVSQTCPDTPACEMGTDCPKPDPTDCDATTTARCAPRWAAPCEVDADCGPGFACQELESCWCSGGGSSGCMDGSDCPQPEPVMTECGCDPTGDFACILKEVPCESDSDCEDGLLCKQDPNSGVCTSDPVPADGAGDAGVENGTCTEPTSLCMPANYDTYGYGYDVAAGRDGGGVAQGDVGSESGDFGNDAEPPADSDGSGGDAKVMCSAGLSGSGTPGLPGALWLGIGALWWMRRRRT